MSRGPGKWQRTALEALERVQAIYVQELLPAEHSRSDYVAMLRAIRSLERAGRISVTRYQHWGLQSGRIVIHCCGTRVSRIRGGGLAVA